MGKIQNESHSQPVPILLIALSFFLHPQLIVALGLRSGLGSLHRENGLTPLSPIVADVSKADNYYSKKKTTTINQHLIADSHISSSWV